MAGFISEERLTYGSWAAFERAIARLLQHADFRDVELVGGTGDHGADVVGTSEGRRWVLQAKYRSSGGVDSTGAREAVAAMQKYSAEVGVLVSNTYLTPDAYKYYEEMRLAGVELLLWNGEKLLEHFDSLPSRSYACRELRDYQLEAIDEVEMRRGRGERNSLVIMATGLGKSMVANQLIANELARNPYQEVLVLAHMNDLVRQLEWSSWAQLDKKHSTHLWTDGEQPAYSGGVVFATWQSLFSAMSRQSVPLQNRFGLVIVDEAHHAPSDSFTKLLNHINPNYLVGLTATPWRGDERSLSSLFGEPAFTMDIVSGMQRGFLASVDYRMLTDGIKWDEVTRKSRQGLSISDLNKLLLVPERDIGMVETISSKISELENPRALAFCRSISHAERLKPHFAARGIKAAVLHSGLPREQRFKNLTDFRRGDIHLLISIEMLNEGIDVPDVNLVAFMRVTHSRRIFLQQLGRGLRVSATKSKVLVLDFVADIRRVAAGVAINKVARQRAKEPEVIRYRDGQIVKFDNDIPAKFFDEYLSDVASVEDADESARLRFPNEDDF